MMRQSPQFNAYQQFVQEGRRFWKCDLYADVMAEAEGKTPQALTDTRALSCYSWFERNLQRLKYYGPHGLIETFRRQEAKAADEFNREFGLEAKVLDAWNQNLPEYYRDTTFHQHNPGVWPSLADALAYEYATTEFSFSLISADGPYHKVAGFVADLSKDWQQPRIMDLGTGFGKLAFAIKRALPNAVVEGIDLSMPLINVGKRRAQEAGLDVALSCGVAEDLDKLGREFDIVSNYWLLHELPQDVIRQVAKAAFNSLSEGGWFLSLDMHRAAGGELGALLQLRHGQANDEPFMKDLLSWDFRKDLAEIGYEEIQLLDAQCGGPFDESRPLPKERTHEFSVLLARKPRTYK